ncbi:quinone oxidoreductase family protein [Pollutimonas bauzanensis]|uniref:NADPH:quinone reductase n=1 Tax=Pollutimonas bauzanensis TaxID=658167 RepID=A0A1M5X8N3_9BURK|nr:zinc-binding dehydrogenase [Pollutimonas bauzanensis]SHH95938.1 NADPH:quinone reductase [Pollutimonas bauzanensis]
MKSHWMQMTETDTLLECRETEIPEPGPRQLLLRMHAAGLNRGEFVLGHGLHGKAGTWKQIGGEGAGEVLSTGKEVTGFKAGDKVMGRCAGAFSEYALMDLAEAMPKPDSLSWEEAACLPMTFLVAFDMLVLQGRLKAGEWILLNGASSGVGVAALQLGKAMGANVIGTSGSAEKLERLKGLGLDVALHTRAADFAADVMTATDQHGADLIINAVGGSVFAENIRAAAFEARLAIVGYVDGQLHGDFDLEAFHAKRLTLFGVSNKMRTKAQRAAAVPRFTSEVLPYFEAGTIKPQVDKQFDFEDLLAAKACMEAGHHAGKIVLRISAA